MYLIFSPTGFESLQGAHDGPTQYKIRSKWRDKVQKTVFRRPQLCGFLKKFGPIQHNQLDGFWRFGPIPRAVCFLFKKKYERLVMPFKVCASRSMKLSSLNCTFRNMLLDHLFVLITGISKHRFFLFHLCCSKSVT